AEQLGIQRSDRSRDIRVHFGGPVEHSRGFVLHSGDYAGTGTTLKVDDRFGMTATLDILEAIAAGRGPSASLLALGYACSERGQREDEVLRNGWVRCEAGPDLAFSRRDGEKWTRALNTIGVDPLTPSSAAGRT